MKVLRFTLQEEFKQIFRDRATLAMMFVAPIMQFIILPQVANFDVKSINLICIDHDQSPYSQQMLQKITASGYFRPISAPFSYKEGITYTEEGEADVVVEIPTDSERDLMREGWQSIGVSIDATNGSRSSLGGAYLGQVIRDFDRQLEANAKAPKRLANTAQIAMASTSWYNPLIQYKYYIVPGILVILFTIIGGFLSALNIVKEKEIGTIEQVNVTPIKKWQFILGKLIPFWVLGTLLFTLGLTLMYVAYGITPAGSLLTLYTLATVYLIAILGFGLLVSTYADSQLQAIFITYFFVMTFLLMSGFLTNIESMPAWAMTLSQFIPIIHFVKVIHQVILRDSTLWELKIEVAYLIGFAIVLNSWAIANYKKTD